MKIDYKSIFESAPGLYLLLDPDFNIIGVSNTYLQATMVTREQILGRNVFEVFPDNPDDPAATGTQNLLDSLTSVLKNKKMNTMAIQKYDIRRPDSAGGGFEERYWSPINCPVLDEHNEVIYILHRVEDVTEFINLKETRTQQLKIMEELRTHAGEMEIEIYKRAQELQAVNKQLENANKNLAKLDQIKTQFFANISHELRTPLMLILGPLDVLLADKKLPNRYVQTLQRIAENARILLKHVNDLLSLAKLDAGKMTINYINVDLVKLISQTLALFESTIKERRLELSVKTPKSLMVQIDPDKIQRVLVNLLANAIKFTPKKTQVKVRISKTSGRARIVIEDSGPGIPEELCKIIFERFFQVEEPTTRRVGGTGLGLAIAKDFIELHSGKIWASNAKEGGAVFSIELPIKAPNGVFVQSDYQQSDSLKTEVTTTLAAIGPQKKAAKPATMQKVTDFPLVLVVEDNVDMNRFICDLLVKDYRLESAYDGRDGVQKALKFHPDLIVSDIMMPAMNGIQLVQEVRKHPDLLTTPIMIVTAKADDELCVRMLREGAQDYMTKPFMAEEFKARIKNLILAKKADDELSRFVYLASHDLKSPLPAMQNLISWIEEDLGEELSEQSKKHLMLLKGRASRMSSLLDGLIKYAHAEQLDSPVAIINTKKLIKEIVKELDPSGNFIVEYSDNLPVFKTAEVPLREVFSVLIDNSIKHHHLKKGHIAVGAQEKGKYYEFYVMDDGPGIEAEYHSRIFGLFQTLKPRDIFESTGVGLSIAKKIIESKGGKISLDSAKSKGATFRFTWPKAS